MTTHAALGVEQIHPLVTPATNPKQAKKEQKSRMFNGHWLFAQRARKKSTANPNIL
jgi:hypothetical protein